MSRITELPDSFDESLDLNKNPGSETSIEDLYYQQFEKDGVRKPKDPTKSFEETMAEFSKTPLFMNNLDAAGDAEGQNDALDAIRALQYEGTQSEIAQGFKTQGNEMVAEKSWLDAREFYTKGLAVLNDKSDDKWEKPEDPDADAKLVLQLREQIYANRALANLELKNYRSTTLDCAEVLKVNINNVKAHYRSAAALLALDKAHEAIDVCYRGLQIDPDNVSLRRLADKVQARVKVKNEQDRKKKAEALRVRKERATLYAAIKARNINMRGTAKPPDMEDADIHLTPDPLSPKSTLVFPVILLYPMHNQSDFIKVFAEKDPIIDHLTYIMPLPWDSNGEYSVDTVDCYMDTVTGGLIKVGKKKSLLEALSGQKSEIVDGLIKIYVVPSKLSPIWIEEVKKKKARQG